MAVWDLAAIFQLTQLLMPFSFVLFYLGTACAIAPVKQGDRFAKMTEIEQQMGLSEKEFEIK